MTTASPSPPEPPKFVIELADEREIFRETPNVLWKSAQLGEREFGLWSRYPSAPSGSEGHIVRVREGFHLPPNGAVIDMKGRMFEGSLATGTSFARIDQMPKFRSKRDQWRFYPELDTPNVGAAAFFCKGPGLYNYAHFLLDDLAGLAMLDDVGALERFKPVAPRLDKWRRHLVGLFLGDTAELRQIEGPVVSFEEAVFSGVAAGPLHASTTALTLLRERLLAGALARPQRSKPPRRIYFMRNSARRFPGHKQMFAELSEQGFSIVDPSALSPIEQIALVSRAQLIVGHGAALSNALFAPVGARVIEIQFGPPEVSWVSTLCKAMGQRWFAYRCPESPEPPPLARFAPANSDDNLSVEALLAFIETTD